MQEILLHEENMTLHKTINQLRQETAKVQKVATTSVPFIFVRKLQVNKLSNESVMFIFILHDNPSKSINT